MTKNYQKKTRRLLYTLLKIVLYLANVFFVWMAAPEIEKLLPEGYAPFVAVGCLLYVALNSAALSYYQ